MASKYSSTHLLQDLDPKPRVTTTEVERQSRWTTFKQSHLPNLSGWRFGVAASAMATFVVMIVNITFLALAVQHSDPPLHDGAGTLVNGNCTTVKDLGTWLHLAINALSTILLSASNYTQQCLVAPTRKEVDVAHGKRDWLDIGIPSMRNLSRISKRRMFLWFTLGLTSIPLHLV